MSGCPPHGPQCPSVLLVNCFNFGFLSFCKQSSSRCLGRLPPTLPGVEARVRLICGELFLSRGGKSRFGMAKVRDHSFLVLYFNIFIAM